VQKISINILHQGGVHILNGIIKSLFQWLYGMFLELLTYVANSLLGLMGADLSYFETNVPAIKELYAVLTAVGWALLIGNCVFQAMKSMASGLGFAGEAPGVLLIRTGIFGFLLIFSRQVCQIGLGMAGTIMEMMKIPDKVELTTPNDSFFGGMDSSWVLVIIVGIVLGFQLLKLFFEIGERYVIVCIMTLCAPLGFAMGGSKSTKEIFSGYIRTYASMLLMMVMNVLFLRLVLSSLSVMPTGVMVLPWCVLVVAIARVARKVDNIISKIGLSPAITGDPLGRRGIGMTTIMVARTMMSAVNKSKANVGGNSGGSRSFGGATSVGGSFSQSRSSGGGSSVGGSKQNVGGSASSATSQSSQSSQSAQNSRFGAGNSSANSSSQSAQNSRVGGSQSAASTQSAQSSRVGSVSQAQNVQSGGNTAVHNSSPISGGRGVNTNRFGTSQGAARLAQNGKPAPTAASKKDPHVGINAKKTANFKPDIYKGQPVKKADVKSGSAAKSNGVKSTPKPAVKPSGTQQTPNPFGANKNPASGGIRPVSQGKSAVPQAVSAPQIEAEPPPETESEVDVDE
jgi:hypothetical protein